MNVSLSEALVQNTRTAAMTQDIEANGLMDLNSFLEPGMLVRHPGQPGWGTGQVQSRIGVRITVNFEEAGKIVIDGRNVALQVVYD